MSPLYRIIEFEENAICTLYDAVSEDDVFEIINQLHAEFLGLA